MADAKSMMPEGTDLSDALVGYEAIAKPIMVSYDQRMNYRSKAAEALSLSKDALVSFRRANDSEKKVRALRVVVDANMALEKAFDAVMAASDELAMIKRTGDKKAQVTVAQMLSEVQAFRGDAGGASQSLYDTLDLYRELGDKAGEAKALQGLASLKLRGGKSKEGLSFAQQAMGMCQELGDKTGEENCQRMVNRGYAESGQMEKAPSRALALTALEALATSVENKDRQGWSNAVAELNKSSAYTAEDVQQIFGDALKKDRRAAAAFLQSMGIRTTGQAPELVIKEVTKVFSYIGFRVGGLGYGPRFQCMNPTHALMTEGDMNSIHAVCCLKISEEADDWERELQYHPGVLDGMLQSQSALG
eukprot:TRINITY_DN15742_c0_g1_i1.p1 TRINITY_DN15742_c0_g1~~TRINITY_DN15742_c0_g1_i1.p1  ORF type:complete len:402 (-),score=105.40 TRINITY_DN15742_c0_g1_i1:95-1180(-)